MKLMFLNCGWEKERFEKLVQTLTPLFKKAKELLNLKNNVIIHCCPAIDKETRSQYDEGIIILYSNNPSSEFDVFHELCHSLFREEKISITIKAKLRNMQRELEKNKGDGRIFLQPYTYSNIRELFCTIGKWYILGKIVDEGYLEVLRNYQPKAEALVEKIIKEEDLVKSKEIWVPSSHGKKGYYRFDPREQSKEEEIKRNEKLKQWFGKSKVINKDGSPKVVYHGTPEGGFSEFKNEFKGKRTGHSEKEVGFHFSSSKEYAKAYSLEYRKEFYKKTKKVLGYIPESIMAPKNAMTYKVYLKIENPLYLEKSKEITKEKIEEAKKNKYDGIITSTGNSDIEYVVFESNQIKSIHSKNFDINDNDINKSLIIKSKRVFVPASGKRKAYWRNDPRTKKIEVKQQKEVTTKEEESKSSMPVKGLNKEIDFKANEKFLNDEIEDVGMSKSRRYFALKNDLKINKNNLFEFFQDYKEEESQENKIKIDEKISATKKRIIKLEEVLKEAEKEANIKEYESFAQNLTPVHSLSVDKFLKVIKSGGLKALTELEDAGKQKGYAYVESIIRPLVGDKAAETTYKLLKNDIDTMTWGIESGLNDDNKRIFYNELHKIIEEEKSGAIAYEVDKKLGTNKQVFSILGPNGNGSGYGEISIILKQEVMEHPDFNMTPVAGTSFYSGEVYNYREWAGTRKRTGDEKEWERLDKIPVAKRTEEEKKKMREIEVRLATFIPEPPLKGEKAQINHFHKSKLNKKENPEYYKYMAKDIAAQGNIEDYLERQSHGKWEGHLPAFVPLDNFAEIVLEQNTLIGLGVQYADYKRRKLEEDWDEIKFKKDKTEEEKKKVKKQLDDVQFVAYKDTYKIFEKDFPNLKIKVVNNHNEILPYMNEGFKNGKWRSK